MRVSNPPFRIDLLRISIFCEAVYAPALFLAGLLTNIAAENCSRLLRSQIGPSASNADKVGMSYDQRRKTKNLGILRTFSRAAFRSSARFSEKNVALQTVRRSLEHPRNHLASGRQRGERLYPVPPFHRRTRQFADRVRRGPLGRFARIFSPEHARSARAYPPLAAHDVSAARHAARAGVVAHHRAFHIRRDSAAEVGGIAGTAYPSSCGANAAELRNVARRPSTAEVSVDHATQTVPELALYGHVLARESNLNSPRTDYGLGALGGTVVTGSISMEPSASRSSVGAYSPRSSRRHHKPVWRFVFISVNQY